MREIKVSTVSTEEGPYGVAELWAGGEQIAYTAFDDGDLILRIEPRRDGRPVVVGTAGPSFTRAFVFGVDTGASAFEVCTTASTCQAGS